MMSMRLSMRCLAACVLMTGVCAAEPLRYEPVIVQLSGTVEIENHFGPPNFAENPEADLKLRVPILVLDTPIAVTADANSRANADSDSFSDVRRVQMLGLPALKLENLAGRQATLRGTLMERQSGEHFTDVLIIVQEVVSAKPGRR